jgi:hypothetical protein
MYSVSSSKVEDEYAVLARILIDLPGLSIISR